MRLFFLFEFKQYSALPGLLTFYGGMLVALLGLTFSGDYVDSWSAPDDDAFGLTLFAGVPLMFLLGLVCYGWEELQGNREFILHRSRSRFWVLGVRTLGTVFVAGPLLTIAFAPPLLARFLGLDGGGVQLDVWSHYLGLSAVLLTGLSGGAFVACVRGTSTARTVIGVVVAGGVIAQAAWLAGAPSGELVRSMESYVLIQLALSLAFVPGVLGGFLTVNDPDRPTPVLQKLCIAIPTTAMAAVGIAPLPRARQDDLHRAYVAELPSILAAEGGPAEGSLEVGRGLLSSGRKAGASPRREVFCPGGSWVAQRSGRGQRDFGIGQTWRPLTRSTTRGAAYLVLPEGRVRTIVGEGRGSRRQTVVRRLGKGDAERRFSDRTHCVGDRRRLGGEGRGLVLGDPEDGTLWGLVGADADAELFELPLPAGDRYCAWVERRPEAPVGGDSLEPDPNADAGSASREPARKARDFGVEDCLVLGERGAYRWGAQGWFAVDEQLERGFEGTVDAHLSDPLEQHVEVRSATGELLLEHRYVPESAPERRRAAALYGLSLLRAPLVHVVSFLRAAPANARWAYFRRMLLDEPLLRGGRRPWLLAIVLINAVLLAVVGALRMRRWGASRGRIALWCVVLLGAGLPGLLVFLLLESPRAYAAPPRGAEDVAPAARLLIESPRYAGALRAAGLQT